ncbi:hypothetical protein AB0O31_17305 [Kitasatospora cineracea]|uniref:Uncharacterized protein n=1 Tax=Kitasatospora cineracea TaxID=88074 RepID=A0A3N4RLM5_9ACTN|nr:MULTISPECIES: hypothetical protein [Kitasatospora]ROR43969.1 hypothetical protein EDD39_2142 [Kitasatospora cineracea]RPE34318.1 hypothetical protein EDD38_2633 [Kitasatospora cineracea]WAL72190.1 hypothetical protein OU787_12170 [Kitasatospora sp. YST-16]WNW38231.1 hypothetical protein RKE32_12120 [Streptomyces sp. Li-HN-5-13]
MRKHRFDLYALVAGGLFTALAVLYLVASLNDREVNSRFVLPLACIVLGAGGLAGALVAASRRGRGGARDDDHSLD